MRKAVELKKLDCFFDCNDYLCMVMTSTTLHIKHMVCNQCIKAVRNEFSKLQIPIAEIELGRVTVPSELTSEQLLEIKIAMIDNGFELIDDKRSQLIDRIKMLVIAKIHYSADSANNENMSDYLSRELGYDYSYLSNLFSSVEAVTIEKYVILQKTERVKELLMYDELSLSEIAYQLGYSSVQHLSSQFKRVTGLTPSHFKNLKHPHRKPLDEV